MAGLVAGPVDLPKAHVIREEEATPNDSPPPCR
jgi:hypothetical protein